MYEEKVGYQKKRKRYITSLVTKAMQLSPFV